MASIVTAGNALLTTSSRKIPLLCTVCPDTPHFSDVSHLLTHISSKGHLHHETQTKLKSHQDDSASLALQRYEQWYRDHGIEALLVARMKAKQVREAQIKRKIKRQTDEPTIKLEDDEFDRISSPFPPTYLPDNESEIQDDSTVSSEWLSLKGQVWPGMGKMDLANEEMKRTRNQRKPKSVIERMRRASEGIEPMQVVMTAELEVERIKGVYDESSSPLPGQEEATPPRKTTRTKRKRSEPLSEISVNLRRGDHGRATRNNAASLRKSSKTMKGYDHGRASAATPPLGSFRNSQDVFRDDEGLHNRSLASPLHREQSFHIRDRMGMQRLNSNSPSNIVSPTPTARELPHRVPTARGTTRARLPGHYFPMHEVAMGLTAFDQTEPYGLDGAAFYDHPARLPFSANAVFGGLAHDHFRASPSSQFLLKQEDQSLSVNDNPLHGTDGHSYLGISGANPIFSQDRLFLNSYNQAPGAQPMSCLGFTAVNRAQGHRQAIHEDLDERAFTMEHADVVIKSDLEHHKDSNATSRSIWDAPPPGEDMMRNDLDSVNLDI
ncbi:hypothetical protein S40288_04918 [Stachybotrys chartarum IBT 40288]|nr:hypothetical protein S40288_04918 [Stachybotrys chartarum IBT 40288]